MRPSDSERCAVCVETMQDRCDASDFGVPGKTHLQYMYDKRIMTHCHGFTEDEIAIHFRNYALDRMLAPARDNLNKKNGKAATRTVKSRNRDRLERFCPAVSAGGKRCMRPPGHEPADAHKF